MKFSLIILVQFYLSTGVYAQNTDVELYKKSFRYIQKDKNLPLKVQSLGKLGFDVDIHPILKPSFSIFYNDLINSLDTSVFLTESLKLDSLFGTYYGKRYKDLTVLNFLKQRKNPEALVVVYFSNIINSFMYCELRLKCLPNEDNCLIKEYLFLFENRKIKKVFEKSF